MVSKGQLFVLMNLYAQIKPSDANKTLESGQSCEDISFPAREVKIGH